MPAVLEAVAPERDRPLDGRARFLAGKDLQEPPERREERLRVERQRERGVGAGAARGALRCPAGPTITMGVRANAGSALRTRQRSTPVMPRHPRLDDDQSGASRAGRCRAPPCRSRPSGSRSPCASGPPRRLLREKAAVVDEEDGGHRKIIAGVRPRGAALDDPRAGERPLRAARWEARSARTTATARRPRSAACAAGRAWAGSGRRTRSRPSPGRSR